jgi:hypothetical protein
MINASGVELILFHPIKLGGVFMEPVKAQFIENPKGDQQAAGHSDGQARDIDEGIPCLPADAPEDDFDIVS